MPCAVSELYSPWYDPKEREQMQDRTKRYRGRARPRIPSRLPLAVAICLVVSPVLAQQQPQQQAQQSEESPAAPQDTTPTLDTVLVTAQKRTENLQKVPISIQAIGNEQLEQQNVSDFDDYAKLIPSLSFQSIGGGVFSGPGFVQAYMRGVSSGGDGNHSGSQPSVGM